MDRKFQVVVPLLLSLSVVLSGCVAPPPGSQAAEILVQTAPQSEPAATPIQSGAENGVVAVRTAEQQLLASLPSRGEAPELLNETWLNSDPLKLVDLRGKVVLIKFWTFG